MQAVDIALSIIWWATVDSTKLRPRANGRILPFCGMVQIKHPFSSKFEPSGSRTRRTHQRLGIWHMTSSRIMVIPFWFISLSRRWRLVTDSSILPIHRNCAHHEFFAPRPTFAIEFPRSPWKGLLCFVEDSRMCQNNHMQDSLKLLPFHGMSFYSTNCRWIFHLPLQKPSDIVPLICAAMQFEHYLIFKTDNFFQRRSICPWSWASSKMDCRSSVSKWAS